MIIENFLERYGKEYDFYQKVAHLCAKQCEAGLESNGIRAIVTYRAKRPDRLKDKLEKRNEEKDYTSVNDIYKDIVDLAGVRIALYFPGDREEVNKFIESNFIIKKKKEFPTDAKPSYEKRFSGYWANHYRTYLKNEKLSDEHKRYGQAMIEIQVASVLMRAWAEVEHDLVYKPLSGKLSEEEYAILDELNGLVLSGEIALERLQKASKVRISAYGKPFNNHYELSSYLYDLSKPYFEKENIEPVMGRADILFRFLQFAKLDKPEAISEYINDLDLDTEKRPIVDQLVDRIVTGDAQLYDLYIVAREEVGVRNPYSSKSDKRTLLTEQNALGYFISKWIILESVIRDVMNKKYPNMGSSNILYTPKMLGSLEVFDSSIIDEINYIRKLRNQVVHGIEIPTDDSLMKAGKYLEDTIINIIPKLSPEIQDLVRSKLDKTA
ncbi:RelA/SpoT domain-containing protein [Lutibacter sp. B2]|nr:RelA/SpoT domain-containing protein [Lutibacter sp. B2]